MGTAIFLLALLAAILTCGAYYFLRRSWSRRRALEAPHLERQQSLPTVVANAPILLFAVDRRGIVTLFEGKVLEVMGIKAGEHVGVSIFDAFKDNPQFLSNVRRALAGETFTALEEEKGLALDTRYIPFRDPKGSINGFVGVATDVTEIKRAEKALHEAELLFRNLFEEAPVAYHEVDTQGVIRRVNRAECSLLGYEASEILGKQIWDFVSEREQAASREAVRRRLSEQEPLVPFQREYVRRDGSGLILEVQENLIRDKTGTVVGIRSALLDVTERKRAEEELERQTSERTQLNEMGSLLQTCLDTEEAYGVIAETARKLFPAAAGAICVLSASRNVVEAVAAWGDTPAGQVVFPPDACWALRSGRIHLVEDPESSLVCRHATPSVAAEYLCVPMMAQGDALGVLHIQSPANRDSPSGSVWQRQAASKRQLAATVAEHIGLALANLKLRETLRIQSIRDPLTGLFNRRYMEESLERELRRSARNGHPLGAIMLDLDHFKRYNDTFGHGAGDAVLRELGNFLQAQVRGEDIACRYGGEEFVLILPDASLAINEGRAEQMREDVKRLNVKHRGQSLGTVTLSLGVAIFPEHGSSADAVLRAADEALYQAKVQGRDRVVVWKPLMPKPQGLLL